MYDGAAAGFWVWIECENMKKIGEERGCCNSGFMPPTT